MRGPGGVARLSAARRRLHCPGFAPSAGIGYLVTLNRTLFDGPRVFTAVALILGLSIAYYALARALESRMGVWQPAARREPFPSASALLPAPAAARTPSSCQG